MARLPASLRRSTRHSGALRAVARRGAATARGEAAGRPIASPLGLTTDRAPPWCAASRTGARCLQQSQHGRWAAWSRWPSGGGPRPGPPTMNRPGCAAATPGQTRDRHQQCSEQHEGKHVGARDISPPEISHGRERVWKFGGIEVQTCGEGGRRRRGRVTGAPRPGGARGAGTAPSPTPAPITSPGPRAAHAGPCVHTLARSAGQPKAHTGRGRSEPVRAPPTHYARSMMPPPYPHSRGRREPALRDGAAD